MIKVQNLCKYYGDNLALGPVSFEIERGEAVGFLGLNGAGKTTALRILACDLRPTSGAVRIKNLDALSSAHEVRKLVGFLPETTPLYTDMTVTDYLRFAGRIRGMTRAQVHKRLPAVLDVTHTENVAHEFISSLSHGYRQRVGLGQAIIHEPELLILDEPTRGLDPVQIVEMRAMVTDLKKNHTVLISSHLLTEVSQTCDRMLVLGDGELVGSGTEESLSKQFLGNKTIELEIKPGDGADVDAITELLTSIDHVTGVTRQQRLDRAEAGTLAFEALCDTDCRAAVARAVITGGHDLVKIDMPENELENIFLSLVKGGRRAVN